jgi:hypothetical protein
MHTHQSFFLLVISNIEIVMKRKYEISSSFMLNDKMLSLFVREVYYLQIFENKVLREMSAVRNVKSYVMSKNFVIHTVLLVLFKLL